jgi:hypothetical protein|tara:strand:+ start:10033 stop:10296 length:264 start_codon:yes stop_codon:yes gene_type:complete
MSVDLNRLTRQFLMNEEQIPDDVFTLIQGLGDVLANFSPRTMAEKRRVNLAKKQLKEIKYHARKMYNKVSILEEKLNVLEESLKEGN